MDVVISQCVQISNHYVAHLKLIQCYMSNLKFKKEGKWPDDVEEKAILFGLGGKIRKGFRKKASFKLGMEGVGVLGRGGDGATERRLPRSQRGESSAVPRTSRHLSGLPGSVITNPEAAPVPGAGILALRWWLGGKASPAWGCGVAVWEAEYFQREVKS